MVARLPVGLLVAAAIILILPHLPVPPFVITLMNNIGLASLVAIGLVLLTGVGGLTSFGQAAFSGFGAYTTAVLTTACDFSPWATLPLALLVGAGAALPLGLITVRLSGHYLPLGTIAWGIALYYLFGQLDLLGRYDGITGIPAIEVAGHSFASGGSIYYLIWVAVLVCAVGAGNLLDSRVGRGIRVLRRGSRAAEAFGVDAARAKLTVFVFAATVAALSGWFYAHMQRSVNPTPFGLNMGIEYLLMAVIGGAGSIWGAVLGAGVVLMLKELLQRLLPGLVGSSGNFEIIAFGVLLVLMLQHMREGIWPWLTAFLPERPRRWKQDTARPARRAPAPVGTPLVSLYNVRKAFGGLVAVNDVSFDVRAGEIVGLIGPNGAGKSTTFDLITGASELTSGRIDFSATGEARSWLPGDVARQGVARTFQHVKILPDMTVLENAAFGANLRGHAGVIQSFLRLDREEEASLLAEAEHQLGRVGLSADSGRRAGDLPLGQLRLLEIARALALDPMLLLLDEPAAGLRHGEKQRLAQLLRKLREEGIAILLVEHDMSFVMDLVDRLVVLDFGTVIATGTPAEVRRDPAVIAAYLGGIR